MTKPKPERVEEEKSFDRPAVVQDRHILLNPESPERWHRFAVRDDHPLTRCYERGQLDAGKRGISARDRFEAGLRYRGMYEEVHGSGYALSNLNRVSEGKGEGRATENLCAARDMLGKVDRAMSPEGGLIIKRVCGDGCWPAKVVNERYSNFERAVTPILCMALDELIGVLERLGLEHRAA